MNIPRLKVSITPILSLTLAVLIFWLEGYSQTANKSVFSVAYLTDIHLGKDSVSINGFQKAITDVNGRNPDFVLTGGDLVSDALGVSFGRADTLFNVYKNAIKGFKMPVFNSVGNHDLYGINVVNGTDSLNPEYGLNMFEKRLNRPFYAIEHKGWKFIILNSIYETKKSGVSKDGKFPNTYIGMIDDEQLQWLKKELSETNPHTPIVVSSHIPLITAYTQRYFGTTLQNEPSQIVGNGKEVVDLFDGYNLKLVLQGHLHSVEEIVIKGVHYISGGAVCGSWWKGPTHTGFEPGYVSLQFSGDQFSWEYVEYGNQIGKTTKRETH